MNDYLLALSLVIAEQRILIGKLQAELEAIKAASSPEQT